jgi:RND superfamily putative drug exporter
VSLTDQFVDGPGAHADGERRTPPVAVTSRRPTRIVGARHLVVVQGRVGREQVGHGCEATAVLRRFGFVLAHRAHAVLVAWVLLVVAGFASALGGFGNEALFSRLSSGAPDVPSDSRSGEDVLIRTDRTGPLVHLLLDGVPPRDPAVIAAVDDARRDLSARPYVAVVLDPYAAAPPRPGVDPAGFVASDGRAVLVTVQLVHGLPGGRQAAAIADVEERLEATGAQVRASAPQAVARVGGIDSLVTQITGQVRKDLEVGEGIALPISLLVMIVVFGGFLAAGLPIVGAIASIAGAMASLLGFSYAIDLDASVVNVVTVLGLGLCIDYGLLLVSRFRDELRPLLEQGRSDGGVDERAAIAQALSVTLATAGRTVLFSGITVAISLCGLMVFPASILRAIGAAGVSVVVVALLVAITLIPALLALGGRRLIRAGHVARLPLVRRLGDVAPAHGVFSRLAAIVQRRPVVVGSAALVVLVLAAAPALDMRLVNSGEALLPAGANQRVLFEQIDQRFPAMASPAVRVVALTDMAEADLLATRVAALDGVRSVGPVEVRPDGTNTIATFGVFVDGDSNSRAARDVVTAIRGLEPGYRVHVTGMAASLVDFVDSLAARAPLAIGLVVLATFVLLFLMTGSVLVPAKALLMNVVSLGASFGALTFVFQDGHGEGLLGFTSSGGIETTIPALVLAFGFGLAMDYEVFLLSRIKELHDRGASNDDAVAGGLQRSGRIITSAALIVVIVFAGFVAGKLLIIKETGVALAFAVAIDATLVRMLLVPATMTLLGDWNWWAPAPLRRLHARIGVRDT